MLKNRLRFDAKGDSMNSDKKDQSVEKTPLEIIFDSLCEKISGEGLARLEPKTKKARHEIDLLFSLFALYRARFSGITVDNRDVIVNIIEDHIDENFRPISAEDIGHGGKKYSFERVGNSRSLHVCFIGNEINLVLT
jgi:hypothetical protein